VTQVFKFPEVIQDDAEMDLQISRLKTWVSGNMCSNVEHTLLRVDSTLAWYNRTDFKGRFKTNITVFYERAKVILIKMLYDKSKGQWEPCRD
jgi:hypothetical protein